MFISGGSSSYSLLTSNESIISFTLDLMLLAKHIGNSTITIIDNFNTYNRHEVSVEVLQVTSLKIFEENQETAVGG